MIFLNSIQEESIRSGVRNRALGNANWKCWLLYLLKTQHLRKCLVIQVNKKSGRESWGSPSDHFSNKEERTEDSCEGEQKAVANVTEKATWITEGMRWSTEEEKKILDIVRRSKRQSEKAMCRLCQQQLQNSLYDKSVVQINIYANLLKDERLIAIQKQCLACDIHDGELSGGRLCVCLVF